MPLQSPNRQGLVPQLIEQLRTRIQSGAWPVGSRIPTEPELVKAFGVGRNTLREAVRALVHAGLLESRQGSGTYVTASSELTGVVRRLAPQQIREVNEVRRALEVEGARLAALRRTAKDMQRLDAALRAREKAWGDGDPAAFVAADTELHRRIIAAAHNATLADLYDHFGGAVREALAAHLGPDLAAAGHTDHARLVEAIKAGDPAAAAAEAGAFLKA